MNNYDNEINGAEFVMKRLIFFVFTVLTSTILYTCVSPLAVDLPFSGSRSFFSKPIISSSTASGNNTYLGVSVSARQIQIGFATGTSTTPPTTLTPDPETINSSGTNIISGVYPIINFQNGVMSGTITFIDEYELKITFQQHNFPYFKMWDVICSRTTTP